MSRLIPLWDRNHQPKAYTRVDDEDYPEMMLYVWHLSDRGYARRSERDPATGRVSTVRMARQILGLQAGDKREADHINHDPLDNQRSNLRITDRTGNNRNRRKWGKAARATA